MGEPPPGEDELLSGPAFPRVEGPEGTGAGSRASSPGPGNNPSPGWEPLEGNGDMSHTDSGCKAVEVGGHREGCAGAARMPAGTQQDVFLS